MKSISAGASSGIAKRNGEVSGIDGRLIINYHGESGFTALA
jgi:hypothetical protein